MGEVREYPPVLLFAAVTFQPTMDLKAILKRLENEFGAIESRSPLFDFDTFTHYYQPEMGSGLKKLIVTFKHLIKAEKLPEIKRTTNQIELEISGSTNRKVNIDPGYVTISKVVLATTKDYAHRLYLGQGIFGDLHLIFQNKSFRVQPWTYPDYSQSMIIDFFNQVRQSYRQKLAESA